ncbi:hypothetical protein ACIQU4_28625 [Streptomyces sp. NPDC090741]|uniref:hypothetical protein n=1 Tax=Streptomyces sp. NPDC090741 TaxID=3365967 RepID=UPI00382F716A
MSQSQVQAAGVKQVEAEVVVPGLGLVGPSAAFDTLLVEGGGQVTADLVGLRVERLALEFGFAEVVEGCFQGSSPFLCLGACSPSCRNVIRLPSIRQSRA